MSYKYTKNEEYLDLAKRAANYFIANVEENDYIPLADFRAPEEPREIDTTAAIIAASGLIELIRFILALEQPMYKQAAVNILKKIGNEYVNTDNETMGIVTHGSVNYVKDKADEKPIIYADYFYVEALLKLLGKNLEVW
ncbi:hypothetical protein [Limosilactobacillus albertensis]|uniref:hypothetical protein n=1 Tax=Limosilactobacillus albertensis TaxID=2759752 RepID=UPI001E3786D8|nr:hypothetical protein [Limosilactobacillus albertensis]